MPAFAFAANFSGGSMDEATVRGISEVFVARVPVLARMKFENYGGVSHVHFAAKARVSSVEEDDFTAIGIKSHRVVIIGAFQKGRDAFEVMCGEGGRRIQFVLRHTHQPKGRSDAATIS
jgi:hypothetical protein